MGNFYFIVSRRFVRSDYLCASIFMLDILNFPSYTQGDLVIFIRAAPPVILLFSSWFMCHCSVFLMLFYSAIAYSCSDLGLLMDSLLELGTVRVMSIQ